MKKPSKPKSYDANKTAFSIAQQITDGTRVPFSEVSAALDNSALRKRLIQEMRRRVGEKGGKR
jgi:hypothetical protein